MTRTLRGAPCAPRLRTPAPGVDNTTALAQAHWCATRLIHHGWRLLHMGPGEVSALTPARGTVTIRHTGGPDHQNLHTDLCAALMALGEDSARAVAHLEIMLRLRAPISHPPTDIHPWTIPASPVPATAGVRIGYWLSTILTDDYGWQLHDLDTAGFTALTPDGDTPERFTAAGRTPTTSTLLAAHLATLTGAERATLAGLLTTHQRPPRGGPPPVVTADPPRRSRR